MIDADLYYSFRSPYSYLGVARYRQLARDHPVNLRFRPVYPAAIRDPGFFKARNPLFSPYLLRDVGRWADWLGFACKRPKPDPVQFEPDGTVAEDQPYIYRLTWLALAATHRGKGLDFAAEVGWTLWSERVENWHLPETLAVPIARAGLDLAELQADIDGRDAELDAEVKANQADEESAGHWGTPCMVLHGPDGPEPFFGQDRIDMAVWWLKEKCL